MAGIWSENEGVTMGLLLLLLLFSGLLSSAALFSIDLVIKSIDSSFEGVLLFSTVRKKERERGRGRGERLGFGDFVDFEVFGRLFLSCFGYFFCGVVFGEQVGPSVLQLTADPRYTTRKNISTARSLHALK